MTSRSLLRSRASSPFAVLGLTALALSAACAAPTHDEPVGATESPLICIACVPITPKPPIVHHFPIPEPRYNHVAYKATHNSYWVNRDNVVEAGTPDGAEQRILDQLLFEGVRSIELDVHRDDPHPGNFSVYHTNLTSNSICSQLSDCLKQLATFHHALPLHDPVTIHLELKETGWGGPFDDTHSPADLDALLEKYLPGMIYKPKDLIADNGCPAGTGKLRDCLKTGAWPTVEALRGKFIFTIIGNWNGVVGDASSLCGPHSVNNADAWVAYANKAGGIAARSAFLMESPWVTPLIACQSTVITQDQVNVAVDAAPFIQKEEGDPAVLAAPAVQAQLDANLVFRAEDGAGSNKPTIANQATAMANGMQMIQNDHPWFAYGGAAPLRPSEPLSRATFLSIDQLNEPGHRLLFLQERTGTSGTIPAVLGGRPSSRWETLVATTRPAKLSDHGNPRRARGNGCVYAQTFPNAAGASAYGMRVCRTTADGHWYQSKPLGEDATVTVDVTINGTTTTSTFYSNGQDANGPGGELLRLDVSQSPGGTACATAYSTEVVIGDEPQWQALTSQCFAGQTFGDQGLAASNGDVLFVGTKLATAAAPTPPTAATSFFDPADAIGDSYALVNLTWPRVTPAPSCQKDQAGGCAVGVHQAYQANAGHLYSTDIREAASWGFDVQTANAFYVETAGGASRAPLYRCYNAGQNRHFYTTSSTCEGYGAVELTVGYVATTPLPGTVPLYRASSGSLNDHLYTTSWDELTKATAYSYEFVAGYVWPSSGLVYDGAPIF